MKVRTFADAPAAEWNGACDGSPDAWLFHRHEWVTIEATHHPVTNLSFALVADDGTVMGVQPLYLRKNGLGAWVERVVDSGVHRHTGLAVLAGLPQADVDAARHLAMSEIHRLAAAADADRIQLNVQNLAPRSLGPERDETPFWVRDHGYEPGLHFGPNGFLPLPGRATWCADQIVDLSGRREDDLFGALDPARRRAVRKAVRSGLTLDLGEGPDVLHDYRRLALSSSRRTGEAVAAPAYHADLDRALRGTDRLHVLFARHAGRPAAALLILVDKGAAHFAAGASEPEALPLRPNDFLHWSAIVWARRQGCHHYRLGPVFPTVPPDWPIARVSRFKGKFGGRSVPVIQGSRFLRPERYRSGEVAGGESGQARPRVEMPRRIPRGAGIPSTSEGLAHVLRPYGVPRTPDGAVASVDGRDERCPLVIVTDPRAAAHLGLGVRAEPAGGLCYRAGSRWFRGRRLAYRALLPHRSFDGDDLAPVWVSAEGRAIVAWQGGSRTPPRLLVGLDVENEIVRCRQGDPAGADAPGPRSRYGTDTERANYLFDAHHLPGWTTRPWADDLGYLLAQAWARATGYPLVAPLPRGARGAVALTGDDDQADLETYRAQRQVVADVPFTCFLHPLTRHDADTLAALGPTVELGVHPDALDHPEDYDARCGEHTRFAEKLGGRKIRVVRNHGYLSRGYLGHLPSWEENGLELDVNHSALDGTCLTGSFLPMRVRRPDGTWSEHRSLLTAFGDGIIFALERSDRAAARLVRRLRRQIESTAPGVLVFNLHPQNVARTPRLHQAALALAHRRGWVALGLDTYLDWLQARDSIVVERAGAGLALTAAGPARDIALHVPTETGWTTIDLPPWTGRLEWTGHGTSGRGPGRRRARAPWIP